MSINRLAALSGLRPGTISDLERGTTLLPQQRTLEKLAATYGLSLEELQRDIGMVGPRCEYRTHDHDRPESPAYSPCAEEIAGLVDTLPMHDRQCVLAICKLMHARQHSTIPAILRKEGIMIDTTVRPETDGTSSDWERETLRMLWTFHIATTDQLTRLIWNTARPTTTLQRRVRATLCRLREMGMAWMEARRFLPGYRGHRAGPVSGGLYHGITDVGRAWAGSRMPELSVLHCMTREGYMHEPERRTLAHSTHLTEYCTRMIHYLRDHPLTVGMFFETESTLLGSHLRMDALIRLRLRRHETPPSMQQSIHPIWHVPWLPTLRTPNVAGTLDATFALEIDEGTESLQVLERKALNYQRTFTQGLPGAQMVAAEAETPDLPIVHWQKVVCPVNVPATLEGQAAYFPIPVCVMNSGQRLNNVWHAWQRGWPNSEVRMTTWELLGKARSVMSAPYLNQDRQWVDLLGSPLS